MKLQNFGCIQIAYVMQGQLLILKYAKVFLFFFYKNCFKAINNLSYNSYDLNIFLRCVGESVKQPEVL